MLSVVLGPKFKDVTVYKQRVIVLNIVNKKCIHRKTQLIFNKMPMQVKLPQISLVK